MITNNAVNIGRPTSAWFVSKTTSQNNVTGDGTNATVYFDTTQYVTDGVIRENNKIIVPYTGYYAVSCCVKISGISSSHLAANYTLGLSHGALTREYLDYNNLYSLSSSGSDVTCVYSSIVYLVASGFVYPAISVLGGSKSIDFIGDPNPSDGAWFSGHLLYE